MDTSKNPVTVNGVMYIAPIFNTGSNPTFGVINNHLTSVPVVEVKDAPVEIPPEKDERWRCPMLDQLLRELIAQERQEEERQVQERRMREQLDQERRQFTEAAIKMGKERAALRAEREAFEEEKRSLQTQALLFSLSETSYSEYSASRKAQSKDEDDDVIMESDTIHTPTAISMSASQYSRTAISMRQTPNTTSATNLESQFPKATLRSGSICGNTTASRDGKREVTIADNDVFRASFAGSKPLTMSLGKSHKRTEEVSPPRANKHPRLGSTAVQKGAELENSDTENNNIECKNYLQGKDMSQPQPTRATVRVSSRSSITENLKPSAPASQGRSDKMVSAGPSSTTGQRSFKSNMQLLQSANAKFGATGAPSPTPISASSRSLVSVATKAASAANTNTLRRQQSTPSTMTNLTRSTSSVVLSYNSFQTSSELSKGNSSGSTVIANRITSGKMTTALGKKVAVASAAQEEHDKSRRRRGRVSSGPGHQRCQH